MRKDTPGNADQSDMAQPTRVVRTKDQAAESYDRLAPGYDRFAAFENPNRRRGVRALALGRGEAVLELGYGTGASLVDMARSVGSEGCVAGIDISEGMARVARGRLEREGLGSSVDLRVGDAARLPFSDSTFDAVFASFTLELFDTPEIPVVLGECRRVLKPEGRIGLVAMDAPPRRGLMERLYVWTHRKWPGVVDCRPIPVEAELIAADFRPERVENRRMFGLAVAIVVATVPADEARSPGIDSAGGD